MGEPLVPGKGIHSALQRRFDWRPLLLCLRHLETRVICQASSLCSCLENHGRQRGPSFVEDCKKIRGREPSDIDVVTFIDGATVPQPGHPLHEDFRTFISHSHRKVLKADYLCDAFIVSAMYLHPSGGLMNVYAATDVVRYWCNFFGHSRSIAGAAQVWKGMVEIPLSTDPVDAEAVRLLEKEGGGS